jgi:hypothetical protein
MAQFLCALFIAALNTYIFSMKYRFKISNFSNFLIWSLLITISKLEKVLKIRKIRSIGLPFKKPGNPI